MNPSRPVLDAQDLLSQAGRLHAIARQLVRDGHEAEDLVQDTWVAALESDVARIENLRQEGGWRSWVGGVTRNLSRRRVRREEQRRRIEREVARPEADHDSESLAERMQQQRQVSEAILALDEPYRSALVLRYLDGLDHKAIAARQNISEANARQRVSRALAMLRKKMGIQEGPSFGAWAGLFGLFGSAEKLSPAGGLIARLTASHLGIGGVLLGTKAWLGIVVLVSSAALVATLLRDDSPVESLEPLAPQVAGDAQELTSEEHNESDALVGASPRIGARQERMTERVGIASKATSLRGFVSDPSGKALRDVEIRWCDPEGVATDEEPNATTGEDGTYDLKRRADATHLVFSASRSIPKTLELPEEETLDVTLDARPQMMGVVRGVEGDLARPPGTVKISVTPKGTSNLESFETHVSEDGSYHFNSLPVGIVAGLYSRARGYDKFESNPKSELEANAVVSLDIELPKGITVTGIVTDAETGAPIPYAKVWSRGFEYEEDSIDPSTIADEDGRFRLDGVDRDERTSGGMTFHLVWISGSSDQHAPSPWAPRYVQVDEANECEVELKLVPRACSLRAVLFEPDGKTVAQGVQVWTVDAEKNFKFQSSNRRGEIDVEGLPAGTLGIAAFRTGRNAEGGHDSLIVEIQLESGSHDRKDLILQASEGTSVEGQVLTPNGEPVVNEPVTLHFDLHFNGVVISLDKEDTRTDDQGRYRFERLRAGRHRIELGGCAHPRERKVDLEHGDRADAIDFITGDCMQVRGEVNLDENSSDPYRLELVGPHTQEVVRRAGIEEDGRFEFDDAPGGKYEVVLYKSYDELDRAFVHPDSSATVRLRVP